MFIDRMLIVELESLLGRDVLAMEWKVVAMVRLEARWPGEVDSARVPVAGCKSLLFFTWTTVSMRVCASL